MINSLLGPSASGQGIKTLVAPAGVILPGREEPQRNSCSCGRLLSAEPFSGTQGLGALPSKLRGSNAGGPGLGVGRPSASSAADLLYGVRLDDQNGPLLP